MKTVIVMEHRFSAAHLYHQPKWDAAKNAEVFGACYSEHGHGHNYRFEVGFEIATGGLSSAEHERLFRESRAVVDHLEHKHLNFVVPEFRDLIPTTENIAIYLLKKLQEHCPNEVVSYIKLFETDNLWVEIKGFKDHGR